MIITLLRNSVYHFLFLKLLRYITDLRQGTIKPLHDPELNGMVCKSLFLRAYDHIQDCSRMQNRWHTPLHTLCIDIHIGYLLHNIASACIRHRLHMPPNFFYQHRYYSFKYHMHRCNLHHIPLLAMIMDWMQSHSNPILCRICIHDPLDMVPRYMCLKVHHSWLNDHC